MPLYLQYALIGTAVVAAVLFVWQSRFPRAWRATRIAIAIVLLRDKRAGWIKKIGRWIAPAAALKSAECGGCDGCG
ncbi:MAG: hypothetical protein Q4G62_03820 [Pseudomonadota bacterium]|nr:hypothetical protein [Pseudomonadota bacterium]